MAPPDPAMASPTGFTTSLRSQPQFTSIPDLDADAQFSRWAGMAPTSDPDAVAQISSAAGSTGKGILIGILSAFGSAGVAIVVLAVFLFFKYTRRGRILLDRIGRPGEFDDEQAFAREEAEALETMDDLTRAEYLRAKGTFDLRLFVAV